MSVDLSVRRASGGRLRMADALLRSVGGCVVSVRLPANAAAGSDDEQLGLTTPTFSDLPLAPAAFRKNRVAMREGQESKFELLVSASAIGSQVSALGLTSADELFGIALGVVVDGSLFLIEAVTSSEAFGQAYLYRVLLRETPPEHIYG